jgi:hypothetical protein
MSSADYSGRKVDLLIFENTAPAGQTRVRLGWSADGGGLVTTGIEKLVQSYTVAFLTRTGTSPYHPSQGSDFVLAMQRGRIREEADVKAEFAIATEQLRQFFALQAKQNSLPEDETLESAVLDSYALDKAAGKIMLKVAITSLAGSARTVYIPVPAAIR